MPPAFLVRPCHLLTSVTWCAGNREKSAHLCGPGGGLPLPSSAQSTGFPGDGGRRGEFCGQAVGFLLEMDAAVLVLVMVPPRNRTSGTHRHACQGDWL